MLPLIKSFVKSESGAVTADFIMLTSSIVGLGIAVMLVIAPGIKPNAENVNTTTSGATVIGVSLIAN